MLNGKRALPFAKAGWKLFPAWWNGSKHIGLIKWGKESSSDLAKLKRWIELFPEAYFCVNLKASNLSVVDIDNKNGKQGSGTLESLLLEFGNLPHTLKSTTPGKGEHYFFEGQCAVGANKLGEGVDIPVMVPLPGQKIKGKGEYKVAQKGKIAELPLWVKTVAGERKKKESDTQTPLCEFDMEYNVKKVINFLKRTEPAIQGDGGNDYTYKLACRVRDFGMSPEKSKELMLKHWYPRCEPNDKPEFIDRMVDNAYSYALKPPGSKTPDALFSVTEFEKENPKSDRFHCAANIKLNELKPREWLLGYRYLPKYATLTVAPGGTGKSLLTVLEGLSIASGLQLTHDKVFVQGNVWMYNTEDPKDELENRIMAAAVANGLRPQHLQGFFYDSGYDEPLKLATLDDKNQPVANERAIKYIIRRILDNNIVLFILDPLVKCHGLKENDNDQMDFLMSIFARISKVTNCACSLVHHIPKGKTTRGDADAVRGAASLVNAARIAHTFFSMSSDEAKRYHVQKEDKVYFARLDKAKANLSPPFAEPQWFKKTGVSVFEKSKSKSKQTTGTLKPIQLSMVSELNTNEVLKEAVVKEVLPGEMKTVNALASTIKKKDETLDISQRTINRKLKEIFKRPFDFGGYVYQMSHTERGTKAIQCLDIITP